MDVVLASEISLARSVDVCVGVLSFHKLSKNLFMQSGKRENYIVWPAVVSVTEQHSCIPPSEPRSLFAQPRSCPGILNSLIGCGGWAPTAP